MLRDLALESRATISREKRDVFSRYIAAEGLKLVYRFQPSSVAVFYPIVNEPNTLPLITGLYEAQFRVALPVVVSPNLPLIFRFWCPGDDIGVGNMKIPEPASSAREVIPDLFFVPMVAFDRFCNRIGYGGGYYDRTLAAIRTQKQIKTIGIAYNNAEIARIPTQYHDQKLDYILTETELITSL